MKKILIIALLLMLIAPALALPDVYDQLRGRQMVGDKGSPWYADNAINYFGTGKDVAITYNPTFDKLFVNDTDVYLEEDVTIAGNLGVSGTTISNGKTTDAFWVDDSFYVTNTSALNVTTATTVTATGVVQGEQLTSTDDALVTDDLTVDGAARIDEALTVNSVASNGTVAGTSITASATLRAEQVTSTDDALIYDDLTTNDLVVNATTDINGATTTAAITVDSGSIVTADQYKRRTSTTATNTTITDGGPDVYLVGNGTGVNTQTILFPTAADNKGRIITVILATDPVANTVILDGESSEQIDGAATKTTTDAVGSMYHLLCNGVGWIKLASSGTWS